MSRARILIVDDEKPILQSYRSILFMEKKFEEITAIGSALFDESDEVDDIDAFFEGEISEIEVEDELQSGEYEIDEATNGQDAIDLVEKAINDNRPYALMFIDVRMPPGIDGVESAKIIRQLDPDIEIVIMTAYSDYHFDEIVEKIGVSDRLLYFHKPFKTEQVQQLATSLTQQWFLTRKAKEQDE